MGSYTSYFAAVSAIVLYLILFVYLYKDKKSEIKNWIISTVSAILLYLPWLLMLVKQLTRIHKNYWIQPITPESFTQLIIFFISNQKDLTLYMLILAVIALIFFIWLFVRNYKNLSEDRENFYILSSILVYFGTILLGTLVSFAFRPIIVGRYLLPAAAVLWFAFAILIGRLKDYKLVIVSVMFILLIGAACIASNAETDRELYHEGLHHEKVLNSLNKANNTVIINGGMGTLEFAGYFNKTNLYSVELGNPRGVPNKEVHDMYNFTEINKTQAIDLCKNRDNVYVINAWGKNFVKMDKTKIDDIYGGKFYRIDK